MTEVTTLDPHFRLMDGMSTDMRYTDDTTRVSALFRKLHLTTTELDKACSIWGLKSNPNKSAAISPERNEEMEKEIENMVPKCSLDVNNRISMALQAFGHLRTEI